MSQQHPTCNMLQYFTTGCQKTYNMLHPTMLRSFSQSLWCWLVILSKQYNNNWLRGNVTWGNMINPHINCMYMQFFLHKLPSLKLSLAGWGLSTHWSTSFAVVNHVSGPLENKSGLHCSMGFYLHLISISFVSVIAIREVKHDVYSKRQTARMKLLPSVFSSLYNRIKIFVFAVDSKRHFSSFVWFIY